MLRLHHLDRSPYAWKVRIVLAEKNVPHEAVIPENKSEDPAFGRMNPFRLTPVLEIGDGRAIYESTVIGEYLEDAYPEPAMLPKDPYERARIRMIEDTADQYFTAALRALVTSRFQYAPPHLVRKRPGEVDEKASLEAETKVHEHLARFERELERGPWFGGSMFSLADAAMVPFLNGSVRIIGVLPDSRYPRIAEWSNRAGDRPAVRGSAPKQPLTIREA